MEIENKLKEALLELHENIRNDISPSATKL